jgi:hypothetical protein
MRLIKNKNVTKNYKAATIVVAALLAKNLLLQGYPFISYQMHPIFCITSIPISVEQGLSHLLVK